MLLFQPLREQLQRLVNRLLFGQRDEPYRVLSQLSKQLEATLRPDILLHTIIETTAKALKLPSSAIVSATESSNLVPIYAFYGTLTVVVTTGMRHEELTSLRWSDINFENESLHVHRTVSRPGLV